MSGDEDGGGLRPFAPGPASLTSGLPGHSRRDVGRASLATWRQCFCSHTRKAGAEGHVPPVSILTLSSGASGSVCTQTPLLSRGPQPAYILPSSYIPP